MWHSRPLEVYFIAGPLLSKPHFLIRLIQQKTTIHLLHCWLSTPLIILVSLLRNRFSHFILFKIRYYLSRSKPEHHFFLLSPTYSLLLLENLFFFTYKIWHLIYSNYIIYFDRYTECTVRAGSIFILYAVKC